MSSDAAVVSRLQGLGIPEDLCNAALPPAQRQEYIPRHARALQLAVRCGAVSTAAALVSAGAATVGAFSSLVRLAKWKTEQLGPEAAASQVPALVQQLAAALLAAPQPGRGEAEEAAAELAFPSSAPGPEDHAASHPACPWLLQQLLQLHQAGQLPAPVDRVVRACWALLGSAALGRQNGARDLGPLSAALAAWLSLPAARSMDGYILSGLFKRICHCFYPHAAMLAALLAVAPMQALIRGDADGPWAAGEAACTAAKFGAAVLDAVLAAGGTLTCFAISTAAWRSTWYESSWMRALKLLLSRGRPPVLLDGAQLHGRDDAPCCTVCPIYAVLESFAVEMMLESKVRGWPGLLGGRTQHLSDGRAGSITVHRDTRSSLALAWRRPGPINSFRTDCTQWRWPHWTAWQAQVSTAALSGEDLGRRHASLRLGCQALTCTCASTTGYRPSTFINYQHPAAGVLPTYNPANDSCLEARWQLDSKGRCAWAGVALA